MGRLTPQKMMNLPDLPRNELSQGRKQPETVVSYGTSNVFKTLMVGLSSNISNLLSSDPSPLTSLLDSPAWNRFWRSEMPKTAVHLVVYCWFAGLLVY